MPAILTASPPSQPPYQNRGTTFDLPEPDPAKSWNVILIDSTGVTVPEFRMMIDPVISEGRSGQLGLRLFVDSRDESIGVALGQLVSTRNFKIAELESRSDSEWRCFEVSYGPSGQPRERYPENFGARVLELIKDENRAANALDYEIPNFVASELDFPRVFEPVDDSLTRPTNWGNFCTKPPLGYIVTRIGAGGLSEELDSFDQGMRSRTIAAKVIGTLADLLGSLPRSDFEKYRPTAEQFRDNLTLAIATKIEKRVPSLEIERTVISALFDYRDTLGLSATALKEALNSPALARVRPTYEKSVGR